MNGAADRHAWRALGLCLLTAAILWPFWPVSAATQRDQPARRVLVLQSYHKGFSWTDDVQQGIEAVFKEIGKDIEIAVEYMDAKRQPARRMFDRLADLYEFKYGRWRPDLIISCDDDALNFLFEYRDRIYPGTPVVFCGLDVESYDPSLLKDRQGYTGVVERLDLTGTIDLILDLQPAVERIAVVHDWTTSGRVHRRNMESLAPRYGDAVEFIYPNSGHGLSEAELLSFLNGLDARSAVYFLGFSRDRLDKPLPLNHIIPLISQASPVPVYTHADAYFGYGTLGGKLLSAEIHGRSTAEKALRVLKGTPVSQVPVSVESSNRYVFDYRQLRRFSIPESRLPDGGVVAFAPTHFLDRHRTAVLWAVVGVLGLMAFTTALLVNIVRRRRVEKELRDSEALFKTLYDAMPLNLALWRIEGDEFVLSDVNTASIELSDAKIREWLGAPLSVFYADTPWLIDAIRRAHREDATVQVERISSLRSTARQVFLKMSFVPIPPDRVLVVAEDITQRKDAERLLKESEEKFQKAFHSCPAFMSISTLDEGRFLEVNSEFLKLTGFSREEVVGRKAVDVGLWDKTGRGPVLAELKQKGHAHHQEIEIRSKTGQEYHLLWFGDVVAIGGRECLVVTGYDQTDRKRAEEELLIYRRIVSANPDAMAYLDQEYRYRIVNDAYERFSDTKREAFIGKTVPEYLGEDIFREKIKPHFDRCLEGETIQYEDWFEYPTLGRRYVQITYFPFRDDEKVVRGIVANTRDITELKLAEDKIRQYADHLEEMVAERTRELEKAQEALLIRERLAVLGHFAGSVSHELRNPLGAIDSSIYYLRMKLGTDDEKIANHLERVRTNIARSTAIIESLLNLSRMEKPRTRPHAVSQLMSDILRAAKIPETVRTETIFPENEVVVEVDADQIRMALKNILHNAVQAMEGDGNLTVSVRPGDEDQIEIAISDTGPGIPPENLETIFQPLFSTKVHGIGFGLSIARMIVENHGGSIRAESPTDGGARFVITLPQARPPIFSKPRRCRGGPAGG
ncbi:MAG: PAS domain S-box protein [Desulfococcaceae bacterium]